MDYLILILLFSIDIILFLLAIIGKRWKFFQWHFHKKYTYFNIIFILIYFIEQELFIGLSYLYPNFMGLLVGFFSLIVLTTVSLQGLMMESKSKKATEQLEKMNKLASEKTNLMRIGYEKSISNMKEDFKRKLSIAETYIHDVQIDNFLKNNKLKKSKK